MKRLYLFTLEIEPLEVGRTYDELPSHLTLMSRFLSELTPEELVTHVTSLFSRTPPIKLTFGETSELGPKKVIVHHVHSTDEVTLHNNLLGILTSLDVEYQYPEYIGAKHIGHVSWRPNIAFKEGDTRITSAAYLIEVVNKRRIVRSRFSLGD